MVDHVALLENKVNTLEVLLLSLVQAANLLVPGAAEQTIDAMRVQADAARRGGDGVAHVLITSLADRVGYICDIPGFDRPEG